MIVVNGKEFTLGRPVADATSTILSQEHRLVLARRNIVLLFDVAADAPTEEPV